MITLMRRTAAICLALVLAGAGLTSCSAGDDAPTVTVLGPWTGKEEESFRAVLDKFNDYTDADVDADVDVDVDVRYEGARDVDAVLATRLQEENPPDIVVLPSPGELIDLSERGRLLPLGNVLGPEWTTRMTEQHDPEWLRLGQYNRQQKAVAVKVTLKGLVWHSPDAFPSSGPGSHVDNAAGAVWCLGLESSSESGWPGSDWLEDILLHQAGPEIYEQWWAGKLSWQSDHIRDAWQAWGEIITKPHAVAGGPLGALLTNFEEAGNGMFTDPPHCDFHHAGSFITEYYPDGEDGLDFFRFSPPDDRYKSAQMVAGDLLGMLRDTPEARGLIRYLTTPTAQEIWVKRGGFISPNRAVRPSEYPDDGISQRMARIVAEATDVAFDASDLMPVTMRTAFYQAVLAYISDPNRLDAILEDLEKVRMLAY